MSIIISTLLYEYFLLLTQFTFFFLSIFIAFYCLALNKKMSSRPKIEISQRALI